MSATARAGLSGLLVGLLAGVALGYALAPAPPPAPSVYLHEPPRQPDPPAPPVTPPTPTPAPPCAPAPAAAGTGTSACTQALARLRDDLKRAKTTSAEDDKLIGALMDTLERSGASTPEGIPTPWPEGIPARFTPKGFQEVTDKLKAACPAQFPPSTRADCDEFPCVIATPTASFDTAWKPSDCPAFATLLAADAGVSTSGTSTPDGGRVYLRHVQPSPQDEAMRAHMRAYEGNLHKRQRLRMRQALDRMAGHTPPDTPTP